jgi:hypothetical protein
MTILHRHVAKNAAALTHGRLYSYTRVDPLEEAVNTPENQEIYKQVIMEILERRKTSSALPYFVACAQWRMDLMVPWRATPRPAKAGEPAEQPKPVPPKFLTITTFLAVGLNGIEEPKVSLSAATSDLLVQYVDKLTRSLFSKHHAVGCLVLQESPLVTQEVCSFSF